MTAIQRILVWLLHGTAWILSLAEVICRKKGGTDSWGDEDGTEEMDRQSLI